MSFSPPISATTDVKKREARQFVQRFLAAILVLTLLVAAYNIVGNSTWIEDRRIARQAASWIAQGNAVAFARNDLADRDFHAAYIAERATAPDIVVLGSSRGLQIGAELFGGASFFNHGVWTATLYDHLAIYGQYEGAGKKPRQVVIQADPWLFNGDIETLRWIPSGWGYLAYLPTLSDDAPLSTLLGSALNVSAAVVKNRSKTYVEIFSWRNAKKAWRNRHAADAKASGAWILQAGQSSEHLVKLPDGTIRYPRKLLEKSIEQREQEAREQGERSPFYGFRNFSRIDPASREIFESFLAHLEKSGVEAVLVLSPYNPLTYEIASRRPENAMLVEVETYLRRLAEARGLRLLGSYDPQRIGCLKEEFADFMHPLPACIKKLWNAGAMPPVPAH